MSHLAYLADMHISPKTCKVLAEKGYRIKRVSEVLPADAPDRAILEYAEQSSMVVLTQDLDFSALLAVSNASGPSVITLRVSNVEPLAVANLLAGLLPQVEGQLAQGAIVSVSDRSFRIRRLPISLPLP